MQLDFSTFFKCQVCGSHESELVQTEDKRVVCKDRETCAVMDAHNDTPREERR